MDKALADGADRPASAATAPDVTSDVVQGRIRQDHGAALIMGALGVVYGDIGTSPLYTIRECLNALGSAPHASADVLGFLSLIFWSLIVVVTLKYVTVVMRAGNRGEGGILALMALVGGTQGQSRRQWLLVGIGLVGTALFYGDGMITPAISVLSAVEGLEIATPLFKPYVVPLSLIVLVALFAVQYRGSGGIGALFGPIMAVWFAVLALLGLAQIVRQPQVLAAVDPRYAVAFFVAHGWIGFAALGAVVLAVTGTEALYADMGHFGRRPIRRAWLLLVLPALLLNYFGQGALVLSEPDASRNPFFLLAPDWALYPLVALSTVATIIASQATISGAYTISRQAMQLGFIPRLQVRHTSASAIGQIYVPRVNWALLVAVIVLVVGFQSSSNLAGAYGIAVTGTMATTTMLATVAARRIWGWSMAQTLLVFAPFLAIDLSFLGANLLKIPEGGWFPLLVGLATFVMMRTWQRGRAILAERLAEDSLPVEAFLGRVTERSPMRVAGTAIFLTSADSGVPRALLHNLKHNKVMHERNVLLTVKTAEIPYVPAGRRIEHVVLGKGFHRLIVHYGFQESPDLPQALAACQGIGLSFDLMQTSFFLGREILVPAPRPALPRAMRPLFFLMARNAAAATEFFRLPSNRVVELAGQVEI